MSLWLIIALQAAQPGPTESSFDLAASSKQVELTTVNRCSEGASRDEIVVCGTRDDRYRLPLPNERQPRERARQTGRAALTPAGSCGIFAGERRCNKAEAAEYGYSKGRDPITMLVRLTKKVADPDAD
jgi:hypothetical protein